MRNGLDFKIITGKSSNESPLSLNEQIFYEKYVEGIGLTDSDPKDQEFKKELVKKRLERRDFEDMKDFADLHGELKLKRDMKLVEDLRNRFGEKYKTQRSEIFETLISKHAELADWFDGAYVHNMTEYDDRINHVDFVLEWESEEEDQSPVVLAIDLTVAENPVTLDRKADNIKKEIDENRLGNVDYFRSGIDDEMKTLKQVPRVVLALKQDMLEDLCQDALADKNSRVISGSHNQLVLIQEAIDQLEAQHEYIKENKLQNEEVLEKAISKLHEVLENKKSSLGDKTAQRAVRELANINFGKLINFKS